MNNKPLILVAGPTGTQGGAVVDELLARGVAVRAIVRNRSKDAAQALAAKNVELAEANFDDLESLKDAVQGATGIFSVQLPSPPDRTGEETKHAQNLVAAAIAGGIKQIVHTSVARAGDHENFIDWEKGRWERAYWEEKAAAIDAVKNAGFDYWTIIKPPLIMENLLSSMNALMFPTITRGKVIVPVSAQTKLDWVSPRDIGVFAAEAFLDPEKFNKKEFAMIGDQLTLAEIAQTLSAVTGKKFESESITVANAAELGFIEPLVNMYRWMDVEGYKIDPREAAGFGLQLESLKSYLERNKPRLQDIFSDVK